VCERAEDIDKFFMCEESLKHFEGLQVNIFKTSYCVLVALHLKIHFFPFVDYVPAALQ